MVSYLSAYHFCTAEGEPERTSEGQCQEIITSVLVGMEREGRNQIVRLTKHRDCVPSRDYADTGYVGL